VRFIVYRVHAYVIRLKLVEWRNDQADPATILFQEQRKSPGQCFPRTSTSNNSRIKSQSESLSKIELPVVGCNRGTQSGHGVGERAPSRLRVVSIAFRAGHREKIV